MVSPSFSKAPKIFTSAMAQDLHIKAFSVNDQDLAALETQLLHQT